ncbi:MAG: type VI secretion system-associated protein TagF [Aliishimia sp.]
MQAGFFGKHPGFGDFITHGLPVPLREELETWLTATLARTKQHLGEVWEQVYDHARPVRFWIGPSVLTDPGALRGVIWPCRDKVGRRYPMVMLAAETNPAPPPIAQDQSLYEDMEARLTEALLSEARQPKELMALEGLAQMGTPETDTLWAVNANAKTPDLIHAIGAADYTRAASTRSYWWSRADDLRSGAVWSCTGLPEQQALAWLLSGVRMPPQDTTPDGDSPFIPDADPVAEDNAL